MKKYLLGLVTGAIIFSSIGVVAVNVAANNINFEPSDNSWNVSTVEEALNSLYTASGDKIVFVGYNWKEGQSWSTHGLTNGLIVNNNYAELVEDELTIKKDCTLKITAHIDNAGTPSVNPKYELYQNNELIISMQNTKTNNDMQRSSIIVNAKAGDTFYSRMYGGGSRPEVYITWFELTEETNNDQG